jgi:hypothetical protein
MVLAADPRVTFAQAGSAVASMAIVTLAAPTVELAANLLSEHAQLAVYHRPSPQHHLKSQPHRLRLDPRQQARPVLIGHAEDQTATFARAGTAVVSMAIAVLRPRIAARAA